MSATPAIPFFGDAYLADTRHLSLEEHGAYLQLMMIAWRSPDCSLPDDDSRLARMLGITASRWAKLRPTIMAFWKLENGVWTQKRLRKERTFVEDKREKNSKAGRLRWGRQVSENKDSDGSERISERISERTSERMSETDAPPPTIDLDKSKSSRARRKSNGRRGEYRPPEWVPAKPWAAFVEMRKKSKHPFTARAAELTVSDLDRLREAGNDPGAVLDQSVKRGWLGVFELKDGDPGKPKNGHARYEPETRSEIRRALKFAEDSGFAARAEELRAKLAATLRVAPT